MKEVIEQLEDLLSQKDHLGLKNASGVGVKSISGSKVAQKLPSTSLVVESVIYAWVCVSDEFDVFNITRAILEANTGSTDDSRNLEMVQRRLKEKLIGRRFLLVLDDVWNESRNQWKTLQTPLSCGAQGSIVLVTTRSSKVVSIMQSYKTHHLKQLQEDDTWQVFAKHAFQDEKCKGLPLAMETIGCLLRTKSSFSEWHSVLISKIWDFSEEDSKIIPALLLSYYHLPSHLKRCFALVPYFPKIMSLTRRV
ncbi:hypothetical protein Fmac_025311 [Flemingia macrophylla]|uniref:NB-ARC domain-containing protein n=1 Tax=Flemingia macrophylla TaxID=520843 RepID=A0ABD1LSG3_9FABA